MKEPLHISLVQTDLVWENPKDNCAKIGSMLEDVKPGLVVLPEMFSTGFTRDFTEKEPWLSLSWMQSLASAKGVSLYGSLAVAKEELAYNRGFWVSNDGTHHYYDKKHLFSYGGEHTVYTAGSQLLQTSLEGWVFRPLVCYDLRFPVWSRNKFPYYDVLVYVASWPAVRSSIWKSLLKARAIENQCYVIGVNRLGTDGYGLTYSGDSCVIDFKGDVLLDCGEEEGRFDLELSAIQLEDYRSKYPFLRDADKWDWV